MPDGRVTTSLFAFVTQMRAAEGPQKRVKPVAESAGRQGDLVFDGAGLAVGNANAAVVLQQSDHGRIVGGDQGDEVSDA